MSRLLFAAFALVATASAGQDGGVTYVGDPPGFLLTADPPPTPDAGASDRGTTQPDAGQVEAELQQLRDRVANLAQQVAGASTDPQTELLQSINDQVSQLRAQLAREQARQAAALAAQAQALAETENAIQALSSIYQRLSYGDSDVLDALNDAQPALPFPAQLATENARGALQSEDLAAARYWITLAIVEAERSSLDGNR